MFSANIFKHNKNNMDSELDIKKDKKIYELAFIFVPTLGDDGLAAKFGDLKGNLTNLGAIFISEEYPKLINLAYIMDKVIANKKQKFQSGYFGWTKFELEADGIAKLKDLLKHDENMLRHLIVKTVRENTMSSNRIFRKSTEGGYKKKEGEEVREKEPHVEINKEELDKKLEELSVE